MQGSDDATVQLWDWRRRISDTYAAIRANPDPVQAWGQWRSTRDGLFRDHPQSPIEPADRPGFEGLGFFPYDPALRFQVALQPLGDTPVMEFPAGSDGVVQMRRFARTAGLARALGSELTLFWVTGYGGGVFLPFADATSGRQSYGGGRYLLDTIKSADLGSGPGGAVTLDFNYAYNPSCCYSDRYVCPLAPTENRLPQPVQAGELTPAG